MKNRYLLVLTLIFGLTGQMAQAADITVDISQDQINQTKAILRYHILRYHPGFENKFKWAIDDQWIFRPNLEKNKDRGIDGQYIGIPYTFVTQQNNDISSIDHEILHQKEYHDKRIAAYNIRLRKRDFFSILNDKKNLEKYYAFCRELEKRADEGILNNPKMLKSQMEHYKEKSTSSHLEVAQALYKEATHYKQKAHRESTHPTDAERAARFEERYNKLTQHYTNMHFYNPKVRQFFGVPMITGTSPRKAAKILDLDQDCYPNLSDDMSLRPANDKLHLFTPSNLARYSFSRKDEFLKPRVVCAIE